VRLQAAGARHPGAEGISAATAETGIGLVGMVFAGAAVAGAGLTLEADGCWHY
jgi:hypothetical protein